MNNLTVDDHGGRYYLDILRDIHIILSPKTYLEIGAHTGNSLCLASCGTIAVDVKFAIIDINVIGNKPFCHLFQMSSDDFFKQYNPRDLFGSPIDFAFLDGLHLCEYLLRDFANIEQHCAPNSVIALHDCLPVEVPMADRVMGQSRIEPRRAGAWAGDVWRTLLALKKWRPDLSIYAFDAAPTGLVMITDLDPHSTAIRENYKKIVQEMLSYDLGEIGIPDFFQMVDIMSTSVIDTHEKLSRLFWL